MKEKRWSKTGKLILFCIALLFMVKPAISQIEDLQGLEMETDQKEVKCIPDTLTTHYDQLKEANVDPNQIGVWYSLAREEYKYKNYQRAIPYYWRVLVNDTTGTFKIVYNKLADCYYNLNEPDSVLLVAYRGLEKYPDYSILNYYAATIQDRLGHIKCAIPQYEALVKANPDQKNYWERLAYLYYQEENKKAIEAQRKVVDLDPNDVEASKLLADMMVHFGEDPLKALQATFEKDSTNLENAFRYGKAAYDAGQYKAALVPFKAIIKQKPKDVTTLEYIGRCYEGLNQNSTAIRYYRDILQIDPKNVKVMCLISRVYSAMNDFETAQSYAMRAARIDPGNGLPHLVLAENLENSVQYCSNKRKNNEFTYDDKVVYKLAQNQYEIAAKDPNYASDAKRRISQLQTLVPTTEDMFMHQQRLTPKDKCYSWINK